jgi:uncharacterized protein (DUF4415 family)
MSEKPTTVRYDSLEAMPRPKRAKERTDKEIETAIAADPDAAPLADASFWKTATVVMPESKEKVTLRIDKDVLRWFKAQGKGYQSRMNAVLRSYVAAHRE